MKTILSFFLCFMFLGTAVFAQSSLDTPFIKKYRPRYEANLNESVITVLQFASKECEKKCSMEDKRNIQKLAEQGDMFGMAFHSMVSPYWEDGKYDRKIYKVYANKGEITNMLVYIIMPLGQALLKRKELNEEEYAEIERLLKIGVEKGNYSSYLRLASLYAHKKNVNNFCSLSAQGIKKFGIEFIAYYFLNNTENSKLFFTKCTKQKPADILLKYGDEGKLLEGYLNCEKGNYKEAFEIFSKLYKQGDSSRISANAGYCLGKLYYHGRGVEKSKSKGKKLLDESYNNGVVYYKDDPERTSLPEKLEIISSLYGWCERIK